MDRSIFIGTARQLRTLGEMTQDHDAPQASPMQASGPKCGAGIVDKILRQQLARDDLAQSVANEGGERAKHPISHRQNEATFWTLIHRYWKKIATRFHQQPLGSAIPLLFRRGQSQHVLNEFVVEKRNA